MEMEMRVIIAAIALALTACGSSTEPKPGGAGDPSVLVINDLDHDYVYVDWQDGNAIVGRDSVAPHTANQCIRFLAQPDSAKLIVTATETTVGSGGVDPSHSEGGNWFNPADAPAWTVSVSSGGAHNGPVFHLVETDIPC
jgi:hypothetical protein